MSANGRSFQPSFPHRNNQTWKKISSWEQWNPGERLQQTSGAQKWKQMHWREQEGQFHFICIIAFSKVHSAVPRVIPLAWEVSHGGKKVKWASNFMIDPGSRPTARDINTRPTHLQVLVQSQPDCRYHHKPYPWNLVPGPLTDPSTRPTCEPWHMPTHPEIPTAGPLMDSTCQTAKNLQLSWLVKVVPCQSQSIHTGRGHYFFKCIGTKAKLKGSWRIREPWNYQRNKIKL